MSDSVKVVQLIRTDLSLAGKGTEEEPYRRLVEYWTMDGNLLFRFDKHTREVKVVEAEP